MNCAIIGCGNVGRKRAAALKTLGHQIIAAGDIMPDRSAALAREFAGPDCYTATDRSVLSMHPRPDLYVVATPHDGLANIARCAASRGAHVLVEKPGARRADELAAVVEHAAKTQALVRVGFNLRFHPAVEQARLWLSSIEPLMYIKGYYGHGGRKGYEREWRMSRWKSGGGVGVDLMSHLIDLCRYLTGAEFELTGHSAHTMYWDTRVEDNLWLTLDGPVRCDLHASWTEWRNRFCVEIVGRGGKIVIDGIGGSYGVETASLYLMGALMGPPAIMRREWPGADDSWRAELVAFESEIEARKQPSCSIADAQAVLSILERAGCCIPASATPDSV